MANRIVWSEGLFVKPQHFQQQFRYTESLLDQKIKSLQAYDFGFERLELNREHLSLGKISLIFAKGSFPDGTSFNAPSHDLLPEPLDVSADMVSNEVVYLALPLRVEGGCDFFDGEVSTHGSSQDVARFKNHLHEVRDDTSIDGEVAQVIVGRVRPRIMLEREDRSNFSCIPIAKISEKRTDNSLLMDEKFMPTVINISVIPRLMRFLNELSEALMQRAENLAGRMGTPDQGDVASVTDFMLLQMLNRQGPLCKHLSEIAILHPQKLYEVFVQIAGELATFTNESRLPPDIPAYYHEDLERCFEPLIWAIRQSLSTVLQPNAVAIPLRKLRDHLMVATISERSLLQSAEFILAVRADVPLNKLQKEFPAQSKIASIEKIRELVSLQLPGVILNPLAVAPRQLPYHAGFTYFQLEQTSDAWQGLLNSTGFALHVAGSFPDLELQFWAIKR